MPDTATREPCAPATISPRRLRDCCGRFTTGVTVVTTRTALGDHGMTVSAFMSVSLDPPLIAVALDSRSRMLARVGVSGRFAVSVLAQSMHEHALHFAGRPNEALQDLFEERHGLPVLRAASAIMLADVAQRIEAGDHVLLLGKVTHLESDPAAAPLVYHAGQFHRLAG
ncbi:flavin reductase family protein [Novosphingobium sp. 1949]|uniref:Flavin reductase family protein n=1 Tax=Novosphingobium organovorum TaxID=2930092 RepID=A0ABT0B890_9SPHN|nr:flavin reductase family protein [Novosphingobium organovorum]MCJ2181285.1 flavin reductase family protein [Novosphingobium organovorum]